MAIYHGKQRLQSVFSIIHENIPAKRLFVTIFPTPPHQLDEQDYITPYSPARQRTANRL
jgi:hypothetical protein